MTTTEVAAKPAPSQYRDGLDRLFRALPQAPDEFTSFQALGKRAGLKLGQVRLAVDVLGDLVNKTGDESVSGRVIPVSRTRFRDEAVLGAIKREPTTQSKLVELLAGLASRSQIYNSVVRLVARGDVKVSRDGTRSPVYTAI